MPHQLMGSRVPSLWSLRAAATLLLMVQALFVGCSKDSPTGPSPVAGPGRTYVHDLSGILGTVDLLTGDVAIIGDTRAPLTDIAFDQTGALFGLSFTNLYAINPATAASILIGTHGIPGGNALVFGPGGFRYGAGNLSTSLYSINPITAATTTLGNMGHASAGDLAFHSGQLYLAAATNQLVRVDLGNLPASTAVGFFTIPNVFGLSTASDGNLYAVADLQVFQVNTLTAGAINPVSFAGKGLGSAAGQASR